MQQDISIRTQGGRIPPVIDMVLFGLGPIGRMAGQLVASRPDLRLAGAVDIDPNLVGRSLAEMLEVDVQPTCPVIVDSIDKLPRGHARAVAIQTTNSQLARVADQMMTLVQCGYHVVSSTEEASTPYLRVPEIAAQIDQVAADARRAVVGTGINPGFVMDLLPVLVSAPCAQVRHVSVERIVNASLRRGPLQRKIGSGMTPEAFEQLAQDGRIGHVGLLESLVFIAQHLRLPLKRCTESLEPVVAETMIETDHVSVQPGQVRGILHQAWGYGAERELIRLKLIMALDEPESVDSIQLDSVPPVTVRVPGGYFGDTATAAMLMNLAVSMTTAKPGLRLVTELAGLGVRPSHNMFTFDSSY